MVKPVLVFFLAAVAAAANPQTGPFFIEGAEPGDTVAIRIEKLEPARDHGISSSFPGFCSGPSFSPDGKRIAFVSNLTCS